MIGLLAKLFGPLFKGRELLKVETWKNVQLVTSLLTAIAAAILALKPEWAALTPYVQPFCEGVALIGGTLISYWTVATTQKIGLPNKADGDPDVNPATITDGLPEFQDRRDKPMQSENSINAGGKGLLGGK